VVSPFPVMKPPALIASPVVARDRPSPIPRTDLPRDGSIHEPTAFAARLVALPSSLMRTRRAAWSNAPSAAPDIGCRQPRGQDAEPAPSSAPLEAADEVNSVFVPSNEKRARRSVRRWLLVIASLTVVTAAGVAVLVYWPRVKPRPTDPVERVAVDYLRALTKNDLEAQRRLSTVEEPPAIRSFQKVARDRTRNQTIKGSFAPLASLHRHIDPEFSYDPAIARFTPKHPLGAAAETLDAVHAAKDEAEKTKLYEKMASGDPNDIFDAAENFGKVFSKLAEGALAPKKIIPTYKMLVDDAKPVIPADQKALAAHVSEHSKAWDALLKRPFHTLKADGPFIFDEAEVDAQVTDLLGSLGDPPTTLRLSLVRFRPRRHRHRLARDRRPPCAAGW